MRRTLAALVIIVVLSLGLFGAVEIGVPIGGLSRSDAIAMATTMVQPFAATSNQLSVTWATPGLLAFFVDQPFGSIAQWQELVWAVRFSGAFKPASCGPAPPPGQLAHCPPDDHTATVVVGYRTGILIFRRIEQ